MLPQFAAFRAPAAGSADPVQEIARRIGAAAYMFNHDNDGPSIRSIAGETLSWQGRSRALCVVPTGGYIMRKIITISAAILSLGTFAATANAQTMIEGDMSGVPLVQYYNGGYGYGGYYNYKNSRDALDTCLYC